MRDKLPRDIYAKLVDAVRHGKKLDVEVAPRVAQAIKEWAIAHGATHFTHWFQPQTGLTAEKHDAFLSFDDGQPMEAFGASQLIQSEPDASSFPSRRTARDVGSARLHGVESGEPGVHRRVGGVKHAVHSVGVRRLQRRSARRDDAAAPQLRRALRRRRSSCSSCSATRACIACTRRSAPEQEYFLIDRAHFALRPDLVMAGRTLLGAPPPRGQQLEDHYFGGIPERIQACIAEVEYELYRLGVPIVTRHNEVAPCQFEMAPRFEETDVASITTSS